jgi:beta-glucosidase
LKGFERITLQPGEKRRVEVTLTAEQLGFYNREMKFVVEPGEFKVFAGPNSVELLETSLQIAT